MSLQETLQVVPVNGPYAHEDNVCTGKPARHPGSEPLWSILMSASKQPTASDEPAGTSKTKTRRKRRRPGLSIQSKFMLMMLFTSIVSSSVVGYIGFQNGRESLEAAALDRLVQIRAAQTRQLQAQYEDLRDTLLVRAQGETTTEAMRAFATAFDQLSEETVTPEDEQRIRRFYENKVGKREEASTDSKVDISSLLPSTTAQKYLQANYTARYADPEKALAADNAGDGSAWSAANARFTDYFRAIIARSKFGDALLLDTKGNVIYSAYKNVDLGTNVHTGPYRDSNLADAFEDTMKSRAVDYIGVTDFEEYEPAQQPTAWLTVAVAGPGGQRTGVLAFAFPIEKINDLMTADEQWEKAGMGKTGETFLVGPDNLMRSDSRMFLEDPEAYQTAVVNAATPPDVAAKALRLGGTTLVQPVNTKAVEAGAQGKTGTMIVRDYLGRRTLQAYAPANLAGLRWVVIAKINLSEAFAPVTDFTRTLVLSTAVIIFVVCIAAMLLARLFTRPVRQLMAGAHRISSGDYDIHLPVLSRDELGDLTTAFNDMGRNLTTKEDLIKEQRRENDELLLSMMPEAAAERYREGDEAVAIEHQDLTVIVAQLDHLDVMSDDMTSQESLQIVNSLVRQFDGAAEDLGIETVQTMHDSYIASCGLSVRRLDSALRAVEFATEMQRIVKRFNTENGSSVTLRVGIDTGPVTSGLIGRSNLVYDMWGSTVDLAYQLKNDSPQPGIYVTSRVHDAVGDSHRFTSAGSVTSHNTEQEIWRLTEKRP